MKISYCLELQLRLICLLLFFCLWTVTVFAQEPLTQKPFSQKPLLQKQGVFASKEISDSIWSPLTELEINTLSNAHLAKSGDPDALLALAIMASGDTRSYKEFTRIKSKILHFAAQLKPRLSAEKNIWRKGFELHSAMHDEFFLANLPGSDLQGYRASQSQFSQIFRNKTYNCISSSLLFLILARYFDLQVEGVVLPSHSFVQLTTPQGQVIEIETTSKTGYGIRHNQAYYESSEQQNTAQHWFQVRNLIPTTYEDYLNREIVSTYQLIADNMNHQHTAPEQLSQSDRYRLQEVRGWLLPNDPQAQLFRLYVINNELIRLQKEQQNQQIKKLLKVAEYLIAHYWQKLPSPFLDSKRSLDKHVYPIIAFIYSSKANIAFEEEDYKGAVNNYNEALRWITEQTQAAQIVRNIGSAYWNMAVPYLNKGDSYSAHELLKQCLSKYPHIEKCRQGIDEICQSYSLADCP